MVRGAAERGLRRGWVPFRCGCRIENAWSRRGPLGLVLRGVDCAVWGMGTYILGCKRWVCIGIESQVEWPVEYTADGK